MPSLRLNSAAAKTLSAAVIVPVLLFHLKSYPSIRALCDRIIWTLRATVPGLPAPLPKDLDHWMFSGIADAEMDIERMRRELDGFYRAWKFLEPFFASHGYTLYTFLRPPQSTMLIPAPSDPKIQQQNIPVYPYARRVYKEDRETICSFGSPQLWAARDLLGRDVVIKIVADNTKRNELEILQLLNTEKMRQDPRNHTIPVIEFIKFQQYTFVIMPRWHDGLWLDFGTVDELMWFAQSMLEVFAFLHEHHIVHFDFLGQNLGINVLANVNKAYPKSLLGRSVTKYALFDFGNSIQYPMDIPIDKVRDTRFFGFELRGYPRPDGSYNPFQVEMLSVGDVLQRRVRHIENIVPALGSFFDSMMDPDTSKRLMAHEALNRFKTIYSDLSKSQLTQKVVNLFWDNGVITPKENLQDL